MDIHAAYFLLGKRKRAAMKFLFNKLNVFSGVLAVLLAGAHAQVRINLEQIDSDNGLDVFEIEADDGKIVLRGNNAIALSSGFHWYLKHVANCHVSWNGDQLNLPNPLPAPAEKIRRTSPTQHGFYFNYCTFNYTMSWWGWERWEREIDYMALCGIDMPLAIIGSEALWFNFLQRFGYTAEEAKEFIVGPGYTAWWMMGNIEGRGGPITDEWMTQQVQLQRKILARMRELGMHPAQPGFVGLVPTTMGEKCGVKTLPQGIWGGGVHVRPHVLHPDDPQFDVMAKAWYEELEKLYGKADTFCGDLFHEGGKTHGLALGPIAERIQGHMLDHNPEAIWTIQGWGGNPRKDLLENLKKDSGGTGKKPEASSTPPGSSAPSSCMAETSASTGGSNPSPTTSTRRSNRTPRPPGSVPRGRASKSIPSSWTIYGT